MKNKFKLLVRVAVASFLCVANASDVGLKKYEDGLYREALELYKKDFAANKSEESYVKALQSRLMLREYENTLKAALKPPKFKEKKWELVHKILYAKSVERFLNNYSGQIATSESGENSEPIKRTEKNWAGEITKTAAELAIHHKELLNLKLEEMKFFFYFKDIDLEAMPTIYDWLLSEIIANYNWSLGDIGKKLDALNKAIVGTDKNRAYVRDHWRIQIAKLKKPFSEYFYFDPNGPEVSEENASYKSQVNEFTDVQGSLETPRGRGEWLLAQAKFYGVNKRPGKALAKCNEAIEFYKGPSTSECLNILAQIQNKEFSLKKNRFNSKDQIKIPSVSRNLKEVFVKVFPVENKTIEQNFEFIKNSSRDGLDELKLKALLNKKPILTKKFAIMPKTIYFNHEEEIVLGAMSPGLYQVVVSDTEPIEPEKSFVVGAELQVTDIQLVYQLAGQADPENSLKELAPKVIPTHHFFVFDNESGKLLGDIPIKTSLDGIDKDLKANQDGAASLADTWDFSTQRHSSFKQVSLAAVAQLKDSVSTYKNGYIHKPSFQSTRMVVEFDRPIFRPGQNVKVKATALRRVPFGYRIMPNVPVQVTILNPQYQQVSQKTITTNTQGALSWEYDLPMTGMLGQYQVNFQIESPELIQKEIARNFSDSFRVEEYKRPDYFVEIEKAKVPWTFEKEVKIKVSAKYYYGAPVKKGKLRYTISSQDYFPWFYESFRRNLNNASEKDITGDAVLDDKGEFSISYIPKALKSISRRFVVKAQVLDESGRSIDSSAWFMASQTEFFINASAKKDFFKNTEPLAISTKLEDLNGALFDGAIEYELFELSPPSKELRNKLKKEFAPVNPHYRGYGYEGKPDFQKLFEQLEARSISKGSWVVSKNKSDFSLPAQAEGVYKIKLYSKDSLNNKIDAQLFLLVAESGKRLSLFYIPEITLLSKNEYKIGESASILFGSSEYSGNMVGFLLKNQLKIENPLFKTNHGIKVYDFKVTETMFNGVSFSWFSVFDNEVIQGRQMITVNNDYKRIDIAFDKISKIKPGQNSQLTIKNKSKVPNLEALVSMYDQSLEFYAKRDRDYLKEIYQNSENSSASQVQFEYLNSLQLDWVPPNLKSMLEKFKRNMNVKYKPLLLVDSDKLQLQNDFALGFQQRFDGSASKSKSSRGSGSGYGTMVAAAAPSMAMTESISNRVAEADSAEPADKREQKQSKDKNSVSKSVEVRTNFAETAVFEPHFNVSSEVSKLNFKAPDQLTAWKTKLLAISTEGLVGQDEQVIVSQKDFFVRVLVTRYLREGDATEIRLKVDNRTKVKLPAQVSLEIDGPGINASELLKGQSMKHEVDINPEDSYTHIWRLKVPSIIGSVRIRGMVVAGKETDVEEKTISILPSRQRLVENTLAYLKEKQTVLKLKNWDKKDGSRIHEMVSLQIDPQLPIMLLNSIPSLVNYPYNCSEQLINKYVPLAIISSLYNKNPQMKEAVAQAFKKIGNRKTITLPWEEKDPRRLMELTETPWIANSKGMTSPFELISFLDTATIEKIKNEVFETLKSRQTSSGGFAWFSGGREDLYITLTVLEGLSEAAMYGVDFPKDMYERALNYVYGELPKYLKAQIGELAFLIYGTYIFTSFDSKAKHLSSNKQVADVWIPFIEKHDVLITPLGHAYMAHIYKRLGNMKKSETSLKRALDGSKKDDLIGTYWAPEERSWMWYSDTIEKHAFFMQTLIQLKPQDERIDGLAQWLLFNRKGNEWKSTKATSKAIFSLMHYLRLKTQFTQKTQLAIEWGSKKENLILDPLSVDQKEPLRYIKTENIKKSDGTVTLTKTGGLPIFAGLTWIYSSDTMTDASGSSVMDLKREFYLVKKEKLEKLALGGKVFVGDEIEVLLSIKSKSELEYVHLKDPRGAGFEGNSLISGYRWDMLGRYEEPRDSLMNFFYERVPKGEYLMRHRFKATTPGVYRFNSALIQSMYAPEMTAYSSTFKIEVVEK